MNSEFADIYDEDHFISTLRDLVTVVHELPEELMRTYDFNISNIPNFRAPAWASANYYLEAVHSFLNDHRSVLNIFLSGLNNQFLEQSGILSCDN